MYSKFSLTVEVVLECTTILNKSTTCIVKLCKLTQDEMADLMSLKGFLKIE